MYDVITFELNASFSVISPSIAGVIHLFSVSVDV